jgi:hypothetical protein
MVLSAIAAGAKRVIIEKPVAMGLGFARRMMTAAAKAGCRLLRLEIEPAGTARLAGKWDLRRCGIPVPTATVSLADFMNQFAALLESN